MMILITTGKDILYVIHMIIKSGNDFLQNGFEKTKNDLKKLTQKKALYGSLTMFISI